MYDMDPMESSSMTEADRRAHYDACVLANAESILRDDTRRNAAMSVLEKMAAEAEDHAVMMAELAAKVAMQSESSEEDAG